MSNPPYDVELSDGQDNRRYGLILDGDNAVQESSATEDQFAAYFRNVGKKFGDFDEQRSWKGGRGNEYLSDNPEGFWDSLNCWTLSPGHLVPTLQWKFAKDIRSCDFSMPGNMVWKKLIDDNRYIATAFTASASYSADKCWMWIRKRGQPGTLTFELCATSSGDPGTVLQTVTKTNSDITDTISVLQVFDWTSTQSLTSTTVYHVKVYGDSTDDKNSHWQVGVSTATTGHTSAAGSVWTDSAFGLYYRVTDADVNKKWYMFIFDGLMYAVDSKDNTATASALYMNGDRGKATSSTATTIVDTGKTWTVNMWSGAYVKIIRGTGKGQTRKITSNTSTALTVPTLDVTGSSDSEYIIFGTDRFTLLSGHGLGRVTACPIVANSIVYFPQGATAIRRMRWNAATPAHEYAADGSNTADFLMPAQDPTNGLQVWRALNSTMSVARASTAAWGTDLSFGTAITVGEPNFAITGLNVHNAELYIFKENAVWSVANDRATVINVGIEATPSIYNGAASASHQLFLYMSWLWSVNRLYGGMVDDIGQDWRNKGLPDGREGPYSKLEPAVGWLFASIDAGAGTSSVLCWDGLAWHEILRGFAAGRRIRNVKWQPCEDTRHRLWTDIGGELIYQVFPYNKATPLLDASADYQHEGVLTSSTIDMGAASRLPKYIKAITMNSANLADGITVEMDYQVDDDIDTTTWSEVTPGFTVSPEQELEINEGDLRQFRYRLRLNTKTATIPPDVKGLVPNGFARVPWRKVWHIRIKTGDIFAKGGRKNIPPSELIDWLDNVARFPGRVIMTSVYPNLHNKYVVISPPTATPITPETPTSHSKSVMQINLMEI